MSLVRDRPGVAVVLADSSARYRMHAAAWVQPADRPSVLVVGRHSQCQVRASDEFPELSLRHVAVVIHWSDHGLSVRMLDLDTQTGFADEHGTEVRSVLFSGTSFFSIGRLSLAIIETGPHMPALSDAKSFCQGLPTRVTVSQDRAPRSPRVKDSVVHRGRVQVGDQQGVQPLREVVWDAAPDEVTRVQVREPSGYLNDSASLRDGVGKVFVRHETTLRSYDVSAKDLRRGVLVGRYGRCGMQSDDCRVSRIHLMLLEVDESLWILDLASTNGLGRTADQLLSEAPIFSLESSFTYHFGGSALQYAAAGSKSPPSSQELPPPGSDPQPWFSLDLNETHEVLLETLRANGGLMLVAALARILELDTSAVESRVQEIIALLASSQSAEFELVLQKEAGLVHLRWDA